MKGKILIISLGLPLLIVLGVICMAYVQRVSDSGVEAVERIRTDLNAGEPEKALEQAKTLWTVWEEHEPLLQLWVCHEDTDEVRMKLKLVLTGLETNERSMVMENAALLQEAFEHLHHKDDITWSNVL